MVSKGQRNHTLYKYIKIIETVFFIFEITHETNKAHIRPMEQTNTNI